MKNVADEKSILLLLFVIFIICPFQEIKYWDIYYNIIIH